MYIYTDILKYAKKSNYLAKKFIMFPESFVDVVYNRVFYTLQVICII